MNKPEMAQPEKMDLRSMDVAAEKQGKLKRVLSETFPEAFSEGSIDFDQLKRALGEWVDPGKERFGLTWPGKAECMKIIQQPSVATLKPMHGESVYFDETENLFIEGDNLEVLKLLQKAYCLDEGFKGNDQLKANAVQTFRARAHAEESEIVFRTV